MKIKTIPVVVKIKVKQPTPCKCVDHWWCDQFDQCKKNVASETGIV